MAEQSPKWRVTAGQTLLLGCKDVSKNKPDRATMRPDCVPTWSEIRADCVGQMDEHVYRSFNSVYDLAVAKNS